MESSKKYISKLTLRPEDFRECLPSAQFKLPPKSLFPNSQRGAQTSSNASKIKLPKGFLKPEDFLNLNSSPLSKGKKKINNPVINKKRQLEQSQKNHKPPKITQRLKDFRDLNSPPSKKGKTNVNNYPLANKQNNRKPKKIIDCKNNKFGRISAVKLSNPDETQPLVNVDDIEEDLIKKQPFVFHQNRRFYPSLETNSQKNQEIIVTRAKNITPITNKENSSEINTVYVNKRIMSSRKRLLQLPDHKLNFDTPDLEFLEEEKKCNTSNGREKCDKATQTDSEISNINEIYSTVKLLKELLQKLDV